MWCLYLWGGWGLGDTKICSFAPNLDFLRKTIHLLCSFEYMSCGVIVFLRKKIIKCTLRWSNLYFWKYNGKSIFFTFILSVDQNMDIIISNLHLESIFDFGKWSSGKFTNANICVFSVWPLPEVQNWIWKQIWNENVHISVLKLLCKSFGQYFKVEWISHCIFKKWFDRRMVYFLMKFFWKSITPPKYA